MANNVSLSTEGRELADSPEEVVVGVDWVGLGEALVPLLLREQRHDSHHVVCCKVDVVDRSIDRQGRVDASLLEDFIGVGDTVGDTDHVRAVVPVVAGPDTILDDSGATELGNKGHCHTECLFHL